MGILHALVPVGMIITFVQGSYVARLTAGNYSWNTAYLGCMQDRLYAFDDCQVESCKPEILIGKIDRLEKKASDEVIMWLNAYVVRAPPMQYYGCYRNTKYLSHLTYHKDFISNDVAECSFFCYNKLDKPISGDFIILQNDSCFCLPAVTKNEWTRLSNQYFSEVSSEDCSLKCSGNKYDQCGRNGNVNDNDLMSIYQFEEVAGTLEPILKETGQYCFYVEAEGNGIKYDSCFTQRKFKCQKTTIKDDSSEKNKANCFQLRLNWYQARQKCQEESGRFLQFYLPGVNNCIDNKDVNDGLTWHNRFISEKIIWDPDQDENLQKQYKSHIQCLALKVNHNQTYKFITEDCNEKYPALCQPSNVKETTIHNSHASENSYHTTTTDDSTRESSEMNSTIISVIENKSTDDISYGTIIGSISAAVAMLLIVGLTAALIKIRKIQILNKQNNNNAVYYATAQNNYDAVYNATAQNNTAADKKNLVPIEAEYSYTDYMGRRLSTRNTGDVYNKLGDDLVSNNLRKETGIYDHTGLNDNEYDVSNPFHKRDDVIVEGVYDQTKTVECVYDMSIPIDSVVETVYDHT